MVVIAPVLQRVAPLEIVENKRHVGKGKITSPVCRMSGWRAMDFGLQSTF